MYKLNSLEWWKAVAEAAQKDERYIQYCKELGRPLTLKFKIEVVDDKSILFTFENGRVVDIHEALPGEESDLGVKVTKDILSRIVKGEYGLTYAATNKLLEVKGFVTLMQHAKPLIQMFEKVSRTIPCEF
jgi:putative sterol carrier protein